MFGLTFYRNSYKKVFWSFTHLTVIIRLNILLEEEHSFFQHNVYYHWKSPCWHCFGTAAMRLCFLSSYLVAYSPMKTDKEFHKSNPAGVVGWSKKIQSSYCLLILLHSGRTQHNVSYFEDSIHRSDNQTNMHSPNVSSVILCWTQTISAYTYLDSQRRWMPLACLKLLHTRLHMHAVHQGRIHAVRHGKRRVDQGKGDQQASSWDIFTIPWIFCDLGYLVHLLEKCYLCLYQILQLF